MLFSPSLETGLSIPYPSISLHAIQPASPSQPHASLFLQLLTEALTFDDHDPDSTISLTIIPAAATAPASSAIEETERETDTAASQPQSQAQALYIALSDCANLHPDPLSGSDADMDDQAPAVMFEGDQDQDISGIYPLNSEGAESGLPPPMPGSGGWITAENVGQFFDEEGNWRGRREGVDGEGTRAGLGAGAGSVRTREEDEGEEDKGDGVEEETKWRRTE